MRQQRSAHSPRTMTDDAQQKEPSPNVPQWLITLRVGRYAYDRLNLTGQTALFFATAAVVQTAAIEGSLHLQPRSTSTIATNGSPSLDSWIIRARFTARYAVYNTIPSLIWGTQPPSSLIASSPYLESRMNKPSLPTVFTTLPPRRAVWVQILCAVRGAIAGSVVLSNVIALTSLWQRASDEYAQRIMLGREPPLERFTSFAAAAATATGQHHDSNHESKGCTVRLAGVRSNVTELSWHRRGSTHLWPIYEDAAVVQRLVSRYATAPTAESSLSLSSSSSVVAVQQQPRVPVYWQVDDGQYSQARSWDGMTVQPQWLFPVRTKPGHPQERMLYLEADATSGDESALSLQNSAHHFAPSNERNLSRVNRWFWDALSFVREKGSHSNATTLSTESDKHSRMPFSVLDLDLKEVAQGFRRLADLAKKECKKDGGSALQVRRVLLVDPTMIIENGGGRLTSVRDLVEELGLADIVIDARESVLHAILQWLAQQRNDRGSEGSQKAQKQLRPVILETPSKAWFQSIRSELRKHGYDVIDRADAAMESSSNSNNNMPPVLVYERSSADTVNTIRQYLERGIVRDPSTVCALLTRHEGLDEVEALNKSLQTTGRDAAVGCICSSDIHDRAFEWVRAKCIEGFPAQTIQKELDAGSAWGACSLNVKHL